MAATPFSKDDLVYIARHPEIGSARVLHCTRSAGGGWFVIAVDSLGCKIAGPADDFRLCPSGWTEPPAPPIEANGYDRASIVRRNELANDAAAIDRLMGWADQMKKWRAALD